MRRKRAFGPVVTFRVSCCSHPRSQPRTRPLLAAVFEVYAATVLAAENFWVTS